MAVLTNFLSAHKITESEVTLSKKIIDELTRQRKAFRELTEAFDLELNPSDGFGLQLYEKERGNLVKLFNATNSIPEEFKTSFFKRSFYYMKFFDELARYPITNLFQLKRIADALSFVILPIEYVDIDKIFECYRMADEDGREVHWYISERTYEQRIRKAYKFFRDSINSCVKEHFIKSQNIYILAPLSFYDAWLEVKNERVIPKYFSNQLFSLSTTLGIILPTQRNLYKMAKSNSQNIHEMKEVMDSNFMMLNQSIEECHRRIGWVEKTVSQIQTVVAEQQAQLRELRVQLQEMKLRQDQIETKLYCLLDPIIFCLDADVDISKKDSDNAKARIGLCFGPEMPIDLFVENGLTTVSDKRFDEVTHIFHAKNIKII